MKKINIAIDGHSSCGKSTIAKAISTILWLCVHRYWGNVSGSMSLLFTNELMTNGIIKLEPLLKQLHHINVSFKYNAEKNLSETYLNGINVEQEIRGLWVSENVVK